MRIATRLWIALLVVIVLVLGAGVITRVRQEQRLLLEVTLRDRRFFAVVLQAALMLLALMLFMITSRTIRCLARHASDRASSMPCPVVARRVRRMIS